MKIDRLKEELEERIVINSTLSQKQGVSNIKCSPIKSFTKYDCVFISGDTNIIADAKIRKMPYTMNYCFENGLFIETYKYKSLMEQAQKTSMTPYYINYLPKDENKGYVVLINLNEVIFEKESVMFHIQREGESKERNIIDLNNTPSEIILINYKQILDSNKDFLNQLYLVYKNNNIEMQNLLNIL
jgi:hypothetical protein